jgi:hypothetical protein
MIGSFVLSRRIATLLLGVASAFTVMLFLAHFFLVGYCIYGDGIGYYAPLRSVLFDGDLQVRNEYEYYATMKSESGGGARWSHAIPDYSKYTVGLPLILFPFVIIGHVTALLLNALHVSTVSANGLTWPYEIFYGLGSVIVGLLGLIYTYKACRLFANRNVSLVSTWGVWFGTSLFYYLSIESSMSHAVSQGVVSAYLYYWLRDDWLTNWRQSLCLGLLLGLATIVRPQNALFGITILISLLSRQLSIRESLVKAMPIGAAAALVIAIQVVVYLVVYGSVTSSPYMIEGAQTTAGASFRWFKPQIWNVLFSGHRGFFLWHPIALVGCLGLFRLIRQKPPVGIGLLLALILQIYLISAWHSWWQGASFGSRMLSNCALIVAVGCACAWTTFQHSRTWIPWLVSSFLILWNMLLMVQYRSGMIPAEKPVSARTLITNQPTAIPYFYRHIRGQDATSE